MLIVAKHTIFRLLTILANLSVPQHQAIDTVQDWQKGKLTIKRAKKYFSAQLLPTLDLCDDENSEKWKVKEAIGL